MTAPDPPLPPRQCSACGAATFLENQIALCSGCDLVPDDCPCDDATEIVDREEPPLW